MAREVGRLRSLRGAAAGVPRAAAPGWPDVAVIRAVVVLVGRAV